MTSPIVARATHVTRRFKDVTAVSDLNLELRQGQVVGLLGPNGAGKSTTIAMMLGMLVPTEGSIELFGGPPNLQARRQVGYLPEQRGAYEDMSAIGQLTWFGELYGMTKAEARDRAAAFLTRVGLGDRMDGKLNEYSKGMQQRVQLGIALIHQPPIVILDEPFSGLDPISQEVFGEVIRDERDRGAAILLCTHELNHAERVCDQICVLIKGRQEIYQDLRGLREAAGKGLLRFSTRADTSWIVGPEVVEVTPTDGGVDVQLAEGVPASWLLQAALANHVTPDRFEVLYPSLHEIVVSRLRGAWEEEA